MREKIVGYLATNFPPNTAARRSSSPVRCNFVKEWVMPHLGQRSRDPIQAATG